jgi:hypothetical protein
LRDNTFNGKVAKKVDTASARLDAPACALISLSPPRKISPVAMPPATVPARKSHTALANRDISRAARAASSSGSPVVTERRLVSRAEMAWLIAAARKIRHAVAPITARLVIPRTPRTKLGIRLLNTPSRVNAAKTPRPAPSITTRMPAGAPTRSRTRNARSGSGTVSGIAGQRGEREREQAEIDPEHGQLGGFTGAATAPGRMNCSTALAKPSSSFEAVTGGPALTRVLSMSASTAATGWVARTAASAISSPPSSFAAAAITGSGCCRVLVRPFPMPDVAEQRGVGSRVSGGGDELAPHVAASVQLGSPQRPVGNPLPGREGQRVPDDSFEFPVAILPAFAGADGFGGHGGPPFMACGSLGAS